MVRSDDIRNAVKELSLSGRPLCLHASLRSFGSIEGGAATLVDALLTEGCTVMSPSFSYEFEVPPPRSGRPERNGIDYDSAKFATSRMGRAFDPTCNEYSAAEMGRLPGILLEWPGRVRGRHGLNSFTAVGPRAHELVDSQSPTNVYAPLKKLTGADGAVVLMGVDLTTMTLLHLAEQRAGRQLFVRWSNGPGRPPVRSRVGSCSRGFGHLGPFVGPLSSRVPVGTSQWVAYPARATATEAARAIKLNPQMTHCGDPSCLRCRDAIAGGPLSG
ncbi:MAG: aminoglycoside N(3)-acetyltransferase [Chitinivibrionales bacterium]|nr:aminoglycoside N(3)-acetyltransferase [Chitinivibrionales bacterium]